LTPARLCDNYFRMNKRPAPITDLLRETIIASKLPLLTLQEETGVKRASIMRFVSGKQSLRLDIADKLAAYFGLTLQPIKPSRAKGKK
jgi:plasmid maintenance system antidote protein VapI